MPFLMAWLYGTSNFDTVQLCSRHIMSTKSPKTSGGQEQEIRI